VIKLPKQTGGKVITDQISSLNVMQTVLDLLDVNVPEKVTKQMFSHFKALGVDPAKTQWKTGMNPVYESQGKGAP
jgi:hypothetical protein